MKINRRNISHKRKDHNGQKSKFKAVLMLMLAYFTLTTHSNAGPGKELNGNCPVTQDPLASCQVPVAASRIGSRTVNPGYTSGSPCGTEHYINENGIVQSRGCEGHQSGAAVVE